MTALWLTLAVAASLHAAAALPAAQSPRQGVACVSIGNAWHAISQQCLCAPCHLCEFSFSKWKCEFIMQADTSLSDGSDTIVQQPELKAEAWFLTEEEMVESRNGVQRNGLKVWTEGNTVTTFAATNEFYDQVYADLEATKAKEHVWITGWTFDDVVLKPQVDPKDLNQTKVVAVLQRLADKKVDFHILGWTNMFESSQNVAFQAAVNAIKPGPLDGEAYFVFDDRLPDITASHHQKTITIKRSQGVVAYVGGIDLTWDRWDTITHDKTELRKRTDIEKEGGSLGWMDAHLKIDGPAAGDVGNNFLKRWNAEKTPLEDLLDNIFPFENPAYSDIDDLQQGEPLVERTKGHHAVQIVRTYSCNYDHYEEFAPHGEASIFRARLKALKLAKNYVYIEDQYFIHVPELLQALLEALPKLQRVIIVTQPASSSTSKAGYLKYQYEMITPLQQRFPNKVQVYTTKTERGVYIHSKLVIIDDVYLSIGSSNWNNRGMTTDTEIAANVVDSEEVKSPDGVKVNKLARDYRIRKFVELTGKGYDELNGMKFLDAANALDAAAQQPNTILAQYQVTEDASFAIYPDVVQNVLDPPYECSSK